MVTDSLVKYSWEMAAICEAAAPLINLLPSYFPPSLNIFTSTSMTPDEFYILCVCLFTNQSSIAWKFNRCKKHESLMHESSFPNDIAFKWDIHTSKYLRCRCIRRNHFTLEKRRSCTLLSHLFIILMFEKGPGGLNYSIIHQLMLSKSSVQSRLSSRPNDIARRI